MPTRLTRMITLTDRAVRILEADWPVVAHTHDRIGDITYWLNVRMHRDGRTLVYAGKDPSHGRPWRGGVLLDPPPIYIPAAVRSIGELGTFPDHMIRVCIASLPATDI